MALHAVDEARWELRRLGDALTEFERSCPEGAEVPIDLLRKMADASRRLVLAIGDFVVGADVEPSVHRRSA